MVTDEVVGKVRNMMVANRRSKVHEIAEAVGVSYCTTINIKHDKLHVKKVSAHWLPRFPTDENKRLRVSISN